MENCQNIHETCIMENCQNIHEKIKLTLNRKNSTKGVTVVRNFVVMDDNECKTKP